MRRFLQEMIGEMASLPLPVKALIAAVLAANFVIITQWESIHFRSWSTSQPPAPTASASPKPTRPDFDTANSAPATEVDSIAARDFLVRRMTSITIADPKIQSDGSVENGDAPLFLYGIRPFNSKSVCTRASGDRWACGLHAYATLRNELAHQTIVCQPKRLLEKGLAATCRMDGRDIALILVSNGLVEVADDAPANLLDAQAAARKSKSGIWDR